ncbi:hypothetical protein [Leptolyngbya sp. FACHB-261]|uniref:hypothetical protein n=1 Tax=Leptolyngbya sp. FACHB-261 TaxID=2692806 RepID=UPI001689B933|nr:hypothetical protein [Leptolyngbya sp. FACHB-261]MBD2105196.1 hypothetical protein [Leptolyngbya sp. FACHB-261]
MARTTAPIANRANQERGSLAATLTGMVIWMPVSYLPIESLQKFHQYLDYDFKLECPTGSGIHMSFWEVAAELSRPLSHISLEDEQGIRPLCRHYDKLARIHSSKAIFTSTNTFTAKTDLVWKPVTKQAGPA